MKTPAIIASLTVAGSIAFAAGQQSGGKQSPAMPSGAQAHSMQEEMPEARMAQSSGGQSGNCEPPFESWFSPVLREISYDCRPFSRAPFGCADVNGDDIADYFVSEGAGDMGIVTAGQPQRIYPNWLLHSRLDGVGSASFHTHVSVFPNTDAPGIVLKSMFPSLQSATSRNRGWRDCDGDGDLDLVVDIDLYFFGDTQQLIPFWFENIGYEKPVPPIAADINGDGRVDGADLGLLLVAWGPTP